MSERARKLEAELAELTELLDQPERRLPLIDRIRVASPCKEVEVVGKLESVPVMGE